MINNSVSFGNSDSKGVSILGAVKDSALNVGLSAAVGGVVGGIGGKIVSFTPYKPTQAALNAQYGDMFLKMGLREELPDYIRNLGDDVTGAIKEGAKLVKDDVALGVKANSADKLYSVIKSIPDADLGKESVQKALGEFFNGADDFAFKNATKDEITEAIKEKFKSILKESEGVNKKFNELRENFIETASQDFKVQELVSKSAKDLRKNAMIGAGVAIGIIGALVLNLLNTYGVIGKRQKSAPANNLAGAQNNISQPLKTTQG